MRARDLAEEFPVVELSTDAVTAARTMGRLRHPGLIVIDDEGHPHTVLPGSQVLRFLVPTYVQDDPALARVYDEHRAQELLTQLSTKTVRDLLPKRQDRNELPIVDHDATTLEIAAVMVQMHSPIVAVLDEADRLLGAVTASRLLEVLFPTSSDG